MVSILLIDDDPSVRETYRMVLEKEGYQISTVENLEGCMDHLHTEIPDVTFLDLMMKPITGFEILKEIRNDATFRNMPIILFTGKFILSQDILTYGDLFEGHFRKPMRRKNLLDMIESFFNRMREGENLAIKAKKQGLNDEEADALKRDFVRIPALEGLLHYLKDQIFLDNNAPVLFDLKNQFDDVENYIQQKKDRVEAFKKGAEV